jgi:hypothetical protein
MAPQAASGFQARPPPAAAAQGLPSYRGGVLVTNALYSNQRSNGRTAEVDCIGQFQFHNHAPQNRRLAVDIDRVTSITINNGSFPVVRNVANFELNAREQRSVQFLTIRVNNPSGAGAPSAVQAGQALRITCRFLPAG